MNSASSSAANPKIQAFKPVFKDRKEDKEQL